MQVLGPAEQHVGELSGGTDQMLAIVQHQQEMPVCEIRREGVSDRTAAFVTDAKGRRDTLRNQIWIGERGELD